LFFDAAPVGTFAGMLVSHAPSFGQIGKPIIFRLQLLPVIKK
jgi:hypothetical protein